MVALEYDGEPKSKTILLLRSVNVGSYGSLRTIRVVELLTGAVCGRRSWIGEFGPNIPLPLRVIFGGAARDRAALGSSPCTPLVRQPKRAPVRCMIYGSVNQSKHKNIVVHKEMPGSRELGWVAIRTIASGVLNAVGLVRVTFGRRTNDTSIGCGSAPPPFSSVILVYFPLVTIRSKAGFTHLVRQHAFL